MNNKFYIKFLTYISLVLFILGILFFILYFTNNVSLFFSFTFIGISCILIMISLRMFRIDNLRRMDKYISSHSRIECKKCHTFNDIDAHYCKNCGTKIDD